MAALHMLALSRQDDPEWTRIWGMVRRLAGIRPVILPAGTDAAKLNALPEATVAAIFQVTDKELEQKIGEMQLAWHHLLAAEDLPTVEEAAAPPPKTPEQKAAEPIPHGTVGSGGMLFNSEETSLLQLGSFSTTLFDFHQADIDKRTEIEWFCGRIKDVRKVLEEPMSKELAHQALLNELQLRRINHRIASMDPASKEYISLQQTKDQLEERYGKQWGQVEELCPNAIQTINRKATIGTMADIIKLYRQYKTDEDNRPRDGVFTDEELQIMFRTSMQEANPRYRLGWVFACNEARYGIGDPKWKRKMNDQQCKILDTSCAYAVKRLTEKLGIFRPDLELDGPEGEYPPMHQDRDGELTVPDLESIETPVEVQAAEIEEPVGIA